MWERKTDDPGGRDRLVRHATDRYVLGEMDAEQLEADVHLALCDPSAYMRLYRLPPPPPPPAFPSIRDPGHRSTR